ncbi:MAG TPA: PAS domain S-box protein [Nitrospiraceae bacterium]|nr:PAS domain S-box protein [Nitrospiraceae bacterium]
MRVRDGMVRWRSWLHAAVLLILTGAFFALDLWTPRGLAVWLLYFIPMWYALRFLRLGRLTVVKASLVALAFTVLIILGLLYSPPDNDPKIALINRGVGIALLWFGAILLAWFTNRNQALREAATALQDKEARVRQALEAAEMATWEWDMRTGVMRWGGLREMVAGLPLGAFGTTYQDFITVLHPDDRARVHAEWERALQLGAEYAGEFSLVRPDGQIRWMAGRGRFTVSDNDPVRMTGCCWDVTDRRRMEESLRASEDRRRILVEGVKDYAIFMLDPQGIVMSWNAMAEAMTGYRAEEIIGQNYSCLYSLGEGAHDKLLQDLEAAAAAWDGRYEEEELRVRKDGTRFMASVILTILKDEGGNLHGYTIVMRDVTTRKHAEHEITYVAGSATSPETRSRRQFSPKALIGNLNQAARTFAPGRRKQ